MTTIQARTALARRRPALRRPALLLAAAALTGATAAPATAAPTEFVPPLELAERLVVAPESTSRFERDAFRYGTDDEPDADGDGCGTRQEVLLAESRTPATRSASCAVRGTWVSAYDGVAHASATTLEVDHLVALSEAWDSGADAWPAERLAAFGNEVEIAGALNLTTAALNQAKSDLDIARWVPPLESARCQYARDYLQVKASWGLTVDPVEMAALLAQLRPCGAEPVELLPRP